jgi:FtsP/CotA-like multicopper oxidase with cupredoxin domain
MNRSVLTIHGRADFHKGESENPTLGTVEDWFIINTMFFAHPIHVHLVNFQILRELDLWVIITPTPMQLLSTALSIRWIF